MVTGMHLLKWVIRANGDQIGEVILMTFIYAPTHLILNFGAVAHLHLNWLNSQELNIKFSLAK